MSELIERLLKLVVEKLKVNSSLDSDRLVSDLESEINADPQFAGLLRTNNLVIQINHGDAQADQILAQGCKNFFRGNHTHLEFKELDTEKLEEILEQLIPKLTNTRSIFLDHQPPDISGFQGRQEERDRLKEWLSEKDIRLVGIVSPGGYGKSTLVARIYRESSFEQKIWITFNEAYEFRTFCFGLLEQLGQKVNENCSNESLTNTLIDYFSNHSFLLVLDNLESLLNQERQFIDIGYQNFLLHWLTKQNASTILLTSREQLAALRQPRNECQWLHLRGMTDDAGIQLLRDQHITGTHCNLQRFTQIADGHPLLLKLAAGWLRDRPTDTADVKHILNERDLDRFTELVGIHRGDPEASIGKLLAASIERLTPKLRELWLNLSVYKYRSIDLAAAQAVATESITDTDLRELAKRSLLEEQKSQGPWQYRFLKLVKDFAQTQENDWEGAKQKAIAYCRSVAKPSGLTERESLNVAHYHWIYKFPNWKNQEDIAEYLEIFYHYYELREFALAFHVLWSTGCDVFLELRGYNSIRVELYTTLEQDWAADLSDLEPRIELSSPDRRNVFDSVRTLFAQMLDCLGTAYRYLGQYPSAIGSHNKAEKIFDKIGNCELQKSTCLRNLGKVYHQSGEHSLAAKEFEQAQTISQSINDTFGELLSLHDLIKTNSVRQEYESNIRHYQRLIELQVGNRAGEADSWHKLGLTYHKVGQYSEAVKAHQEALRIYRDIGNASERIQVLHSLADAYHALGDYQRAIEARQEAESGNDLERARKLLGLGHDYNSSMQYQNAIQSFEEALPIFQRIHHREGEANTLLGLGNVYVNLANIYRNINESLQQSFDADGHYSQARDYYRQVSEISRELGDREGEAAVLNNLGVIEENLDQYLDAASSYERSLQISCELGNLEDEARNRHNLGRVCNLLGQNYYNQRLYQQAKLLYQQALSAFEGIKGNFRTGQTQEGEKTALLGLGNAYHFLGQFLDAMNLHQRTLEITRQLGDRPGEAEALLGLGNAYYSLGNYNKPNDKNAFNFYQEALRIFQELKAEQGEAKVKLGLGKTYHSLGKCQEAIKYLGEGGS